MKSELSRQPPRRRSDSRTASWQCRGCSPTARRTQKSAQGSAAGTG